jgi:hypothetical protein
VASIDFISGERRLDRRYELALNVRFTYEMDQHSNCGYGITRNLSRGGLKFHTDTPPPEGSDLVLHVSWPFLLQNVCPLELVIWGKVLKSDGESATVVMRDYEFKTCGERSFAGASQHEGICGITA